MHISGWWWCIKPWIGKPVGLFSMLMAQIYRFSFSCLISPLPLINIALCLLSGMEMSLIPSHLEKAMKNIWCQNEGNKGISTLALAKKNSKIVLNAVTGSYYVSRKRVAGLFTVWPRNRKETIRLSGETEKTCKSFNSGKAKHWKLYAGSCLITRRRNQPVTIVAIGISMWMWATVRMIRLSWAQLSQGLNNTLKSMRLKIMKKTTICAMIIQQCTFGQRWYWKKYI